MKYARWKRRTHLFKKDDYVCSSCGFVTRRPRNVCPGCGTAMRGRFVKPAYWIRVTNLFRRDEYFCSACGASFKRSYRTCPSCGASMKKTKYDPHWVDDAAVMHTFFD